MATDYWRYPYKTGCNDKDPLIGMSDVIRAEVLSLNTISPVESTTLFGS